MDVEDDSYQTLAFFYNREMDQLMVANTIINEVDAKDILGLDDQEKSKVPKMTYLEDTKMDSKEEHEAT
jgi:hypothetical protein